jgi:hypothetical protein
MEAQALSSIRLDDPACFRQSKGIRPSSYFSICRMTPFELAVRTDAVVPARPDPT